MDQSVDFTRRRVLALGAAAATVSVAGITAASGLPGLPGCPADPLLPLLAEWEATRDVVNQLGRYRSDLPDDDPELVMFMTRWGEIEEEIIASHRPTTLEGCLAAIERAREEYAEFHLSACRSARFIMALLDGAADTLRTAARGAA